MTNRTVSESRTLMVECARLHLLGASDAEIQRQTGIARSTLNRWRRDNHQFQGIIAEAQAIMGREVAGHLVGIVPAAFQCVREAIEAGDAKTAMALLTASGALQTGGRIVGMSSAAGKAESGGGIVINVNLDQSSDQKPPVDVSAVVDMG